MTDSTTDSGSPEEGEGAAGELEPGLDQEVAWEAEPPERPSDRELLERLVRAHEQQSASLAAIRGHTGCIVTWLVVLLVLRIIVALL